MKHFTLKDIAAQETRYKAHFINAITGYKSANLIATKSKEGITNLAVFNSIIHLGSNPPLLGFILRPTTVPRHTFENLKSTDVFTVNAITQDRIAEAHHTSAKYPEGVSEFDVTAFDAEYKTDFYAPFVGGAPIQIGCRYKNHYRIEENNTLLIVGEMEHLFVEEKMISEDGWVQLDKGNIVAINGLEGYALPKHLDRFSYARPKE